MKLIQSYLEEQYFVSTIHRKSSTSPPLRYYETMVWEWDKETRKRGKLLAQHDSGVGKHSAIDDHALICIELLREGGL